MFLTYIDEYINDSYELNDDSLIFWIRCLNKAIPLVLNDQLTLEKTFEYYSKYMAPYQVACLCAMYQYLNRRHEIIIPSFLVETQSEINYVLGGVGKVDPYLKAVGIIVHGRCFYVDESNNIKNEEPNGANIKF